MLEEKPSYYSILTAEVRYDKDLTPNAKLLYSEITALTNKKGYCWATNDYFAKLYNVSKKSISTWVSSLAEKGYIDVKIIYKKDTKIIAGRYITLKVVEPPTPEEVLSAYGIGMPGEENFHTLENNSSIPIEENFHRVENKTSIPIEENFHTPMEEKVTDNNKVFNTTKNTKKNNKDIYSAEISTIITYLNNVLGSNYKADSKATIALCKKLLDEGYTVEDFKAVIDKKNAEWKDDPNMSVYLRPATLFQYGKFEGYLNQKTVARTNQVRTTLLGEKGCIYSDDELPF